VDFLIGPSFDTDLGGKLRDTERDRLPAIPECLEDGPGVICGRSEVVMAHVR
jgi:hypothetical protein